MLCRQKTAQDDWFGLLMVLLPSRSISGKHMVMVLDPIYLIYRLCYAPCIQFHFSASIPRTPLTVSNMTGGERYRERRERVT